MQDINSSLSVPFQNWVQAKKVKPQDLRFLTLLTSLEHQEKFSKVTDAFFATGPTFSEGLQVMETVVDLVLMKKSDQIPPFSTIDVWRQQLAHVRHPVTTAHDDVRKAAIEKLKWPSGSKIKVERRGDRHGVELKVFISSATDLTKVIASLERAKDDFPI